MEQPKPGQLYKHFKGDTYKIITLARHSETMEWFVVYERITSKLHSGDPFFIRPLDMFLEIVEKDGKKFPRFELIK